MMPGRKWFVLTIDVLGAVVVAASLFGVFWLTEVRGRSAEDEIASLTRTIGAVRRDLSILQAERDRQKAILRRHAADLADRGRLPEQTPVEEYFQSLSKLADRNRVLVARQNPLSPRSYPGVLETRYAYEVRGSMPDLAQFLKGIEEADFWADVSYLRILEGQGGQNRPGAERVALLTISVFSALPAAPTSESG